MVRYMTSPQFPDFYICCIVLVSTLLTYHWQYVVKQLIKFLVFPNPSLPYLPPRELVYSRVLKQSTNMY